jgi:hypothetical protein
MGGELAAPVAEQQQGTGTRDDEPRREGNRRVGQCGVGRAWPCRGRCSDSHAGGSLSEAHAVECSSNDQSKLPQMEDLLFGPHSLREHVCCPNGAGGPSCDDEPSRPTRPTLLPRRRIHLSPSLSATLRRWTRQVYSPSSALPCLHSSFDHSAPHACPPRSNRFSSLADLLHLCFKAWILSVCGLTDAC